MRRNRQQVRALLERDGVLQLLSCLEQCDFVPRAHMLACVADLLAHPEAAEQAREWRGLQRQSAVQLLLRLWKEDEARHFGACGTGALRSTTRPAT